MTKQARRSKEKDHALLRQIFEKVRCNNASSSALLRASCLVIPSTFVIRASSFSSRAHGNAGGAFEFAPANPCAFDRTENRFPNAITQHRPIDQPHRQNPPRARDRFAFYNASERRQDDVLRKKCNYKREYR